MPATPFNSVETSTAELEAFLRATLPGTGPYCLADRPPGVEGKLRQTFHETLREMASAAVRLAAEGREVFHAVASFVQMGSRKGDNVARLRSLWLDVDCGPGDPGRPKPYATAGEGAKAVHAFCKASGLPKPMLVSSGRGIHVYWPLAQEVDLATWRTLATGLKAATEQLGLKADPSRTADAASILRPIETLHLKAEPRPVRLLMDAAATPVGELMASLSPWVPQNTDQLANRPDWLASMRHLLGTADELATQRSHAPAFADQIADECRIIGMIRETRGAVDQPTWYNGLSILARCEGGEKVAHEWSKGDPRYTPQETQGAIDRALRFGPATCAKLGEQHSLTCRLCPHFGRVRSPITLGEQAAVPPAATALAAPAPTDLDQFRASHRLLTQPPYKRQPELGDLLHIGEVTILGNMGGGWKTSTAIGMMLSVASGLPLLGFEVYQPGTVLYVGLEEGQGELELKLRGAVQFHGKAHVLPPETLDRIVTLGSDHTAAIRFTTMDPVTRREGLNSPAFAQLEQWMASATPRVVVIDPISTAMTYGNNDNGLVYAVLLRLKALAARFHCAIVALAHVNKAAVPGSENATGVMGASAWVNGARKVLSFTRLTEQEVAAVGGDFGASILRIVDQKSNFTPRNGDRYLAVEGEYVRNATPPVYPKDDSVAVVTEFKAVQGGRQTPAGALRATLVTLAAGKLGAGVPYTEKKQSPDRFYLADVAAALVPYISGVDPAQTKAASEALARAALLHVMSHGWVESFDAPVGRNTRKGLRVRWANTPWAADPMPVGPYVVP